MKRHLTPDYLSYSGCEWVPRAGVLPCVKQAVEASRVALLPHNRVINDCWALDIFKTHAKVRVGRDDSPWISREPESVHLYPPKLQYWEDSPPGPSAVHHGWLQFQTQEPFELERFTRNRYGFAVFLDDDGLIREKFNEILAVGQDYGDSGFWRAQASFCHLLDLLTNAEPVRGREYRVTGRVSLDPLVLTVRRFFREHLGHPLLLKTIANAAHVSVSTLTHRYVELTGESPKQTLNALRIERVCDLLQRGSTVKEAAALSGFSSPQHLARAFKTVEGMTPSEFIHYTRESDATITGQGKADQA
jgi:AraC-like DNA-binding protein